MIRPPINTYRIETILSIAWTTFLVVFVLGSFLFMWAQDQAAQSICEELSRARGLNDGC